LLVGLLSLSLLILWPSGSSLPEDYAEAGDDTVHLAGKPAAASFNLTGSGVEPASQTVELGETVEFVNSVDSELVVSFDRSDDEISLNPSESETLLINGITYFTVSGEDYSAQGRVNVQ
jgi:hypothetical protein